MNEDMTLNLLNDLRELSNEQRKFSVTTTRDGWITIAVGKHSYQTQAFSLNVLMQANIHIRASIMTEEALYEHDFLK